MSLELCNGEKLKEHEFGRSTGVSTRGGTAILLARLGDLYAGEKGETNDESPRGKVFISILLSRRTTPGSLYTLLFLRAAKARCQSHISALYKNTFFAMSLQNLLIFLALL